MSQNSNSFEFQKIQNYLNFTKFEIIRILDNPKLMKFQKTQNSNYTKFKIVRVAQNSTRFQPHEI